MAMGLVLVPPHLSGATLSRSKLKKKDEKKNRKKILRRKFLPQIFFLIEFVSRHWSSFTR